MTYPLSVVGVVDAADGRALAVHARARHAHLQREELVALQQYVDAYNNSSQSVSKNKAITMNMVKALKKKTLEIPH